MVRTVEKTKDVKEPKEKKDLVGLVTSMVTSNNHSSFL